MNDRPRDFAAPPMSPCIKVCAMDAADRYCTGCWRTRNEIAAWFAMNDADKRAVLAALPARRASEPACGPHGSQPGGG